MIRKNARRNVSAVLGAALAVSSPAFARVAATVGLSVAGILAASRPAHASLSYGWHDLGGGDEVAVFTAGDARAYADKLVQTTSFQDKLNWIAGLLIKYGLGNNQALQIARLICYNGLSWAVRARIYWAASHSNVVYVYHKWYFPYWADPV